MDHFYWSPTLKWQLCTTKSKNANKNTEKKFGFVTKYIMLRQNNEASKVYHFANIK